MRHVAELSNPVMTGDTFTKENADLTLYVTRCPGESIIDVSEERGTDTLYAAIYQYGQAYGTRDSDRDPQS